MERKNHCAKEPVCTMDDTDAVYMKTFMAYCMWKKAINDIILAYKFQKMDSSGRAAKYRNVHEALSHFNNKMNRWFNSTETNSCIQPYVIGRKHAEDLPKNLQSIQKVDGSVIAVEVSSIFEAMAQKIVNAMEPTGDTFARIVIDMGTCAFTIHRFVDKGQGNSFCHYALEFKFTCVQKDKKPPSVRMDISNARAKSYRAAQKDDIALILPEEFRQQLLDWCNSR
jgi:hypothetical protein